MAHEKYRAAMAADAAFTRELERVYGKKNAGDARYKMHHTDRKVTAAKLRKLRADEQLRREFARLRGEKVTNPTPRRGSFPRGKTPPHLKKYLFKKKSRR